ncbi:S8 family serine peptidase [Tepidicaulis sp.]|uniref:S8 family serine peptidase n=1 Tax=Tepidicaulis sp. TaxID=1920809 RepID=UPI003B5B4F0B
MMWDGSALLPLDELSRQDGQALVRIPADAALTPGANYEILLLKARSGLLSAPSQASAHVQGAQSVARITACARAASISGQEGAARDLILMAGEEESARIEARLIAEGFEVRERILLPSLGRVLFVILPKEGASLAEAREELRRTFPEAQTDFNHLYGLSAGPKLFAPGLIGWESPACPKSAGAQGDAAFGIIDDGVNGAHPALSGAAGLTLGDFSGEGDGRGSDHGTGIAALLIGEGKSETGFQGLLPGARLYAADIFSGPPEAAEASAARFLTALDWLMARQVRYVNLSLAGPPNRLLEEGLSYSARQGVLFVAAAGNEGPGAPVAYPAAYDSVIAVTAIDAARRIYVKANQGAYVDFAAPGVDIWLAKAQGGGSYRSGTSYAAPFVLALSAALMTAAPAEARADPLTHVRAQLKAHAEDLGAPGYDPVFGFGLVRASEACF